MTRPSDSDAEGRVSNRHLEALLRQSADMVAVLDADLRIVYINEAARRILGRPTSSFLGRPAFEFVHPDDVPSAIEALTRTGAGPAVGLRLSHADGRWIPTEVAGDITLSDPDVGGIVINVRDVSDRLRVEATLHSERRFLRAILQEMEDGIAAYGPDGQLRMINEAARAFFGMAGREVGPEEWATEYALYEADGVTPLVDADTPVQRALRGESVACEMVVVPKHGPRRVLWTSGRPIYDADGAFVGAVSAMHDVTTNREAEARLQHQAMHDPLTGLPNRALVLDRIRQAITRSGGESGQVALLFLDLDRFKIVNDSLGHRVGDRLLQEVGLRLTAAVRDADTVGRLGGDEFVVLCEPVNGVAEAIAIAERIEAGLSAPFSLDDRDVHVTASIGIAMAGAHPVPDGGGLAAPEALLRDADSAMYRAKDLGRARLEVFDEATRQSVVHRLEVEQRLTRAIEKEWLRALYQPIYDVASGRLVGVEALIRYVDPERGMISPDEFLAVAEDTGLVTRLDTWILNQACADARRWSRLVPGTSLQVGVNVSARQLARSDFYDTVVSALVSSGLDASDLALEITETELVEATPNAISATHRLRSIGVHVGADDFGTGYSSLLHLRHFPVDFLKIDRSFIDGLAADQDDATIVEAVISLGHALGLTVVAEGVETEEQLTRLVALGCDSYQGFLRSRPEESGRILDLLRR